MANTNEIDQIDLNLTLRTDKAQETAQLVLNNLIQIENKLIAIGRKPFTLGGGLDKVGKDIANIQDLINKFNKEVGKQEVSWGTIVKFINENQKAIIAVERQVESLNKTIKSGLKEQEVLQNRINVSKEYNNKLAYKEQLTQEKINTAKAKTALEEQLALAKRQVYEQASDKAYSTKLGKAQLETQATLATLKALQGMAQTEEVITRTKKVQADLNERGIIERKAKLADQQADENYNSVMSIHSAKRALGYTALFAGIGAVTGALGAMTSNVIEADLQMRTLGAVLKLNLTQARDLSESIRDLGNTYGGSLKEIEGVALALARAGIATKDMIPATEIVLRMARLTGDTFEQSASAIISFQQVFGNTTSIEALGNKLAYIANMSRLSTQDIGTFSNYALAAAKAVGMTEDAVGALATAFSVAGSNSSTIGTQIRTITGIFTESSKDITDFFQGIGVSQEMMQNRLQQGGKVSNQAMREFVDILASVDSMTFNKLTGSMDKLTVNALNLMRNNKDNVQLFMNELEAGAEGQLKVVDTILEAHRVTMEKWWNTFLNYSQKQVTNLEEMLSDTSLNQKILNLQATMNKKTDESQKQELKNLLIVKEIKEDNVKLTALNAKIEASTGEEYLKLSEQKRALLIKIANERDSLENKTIGKTKEQIALEIKNREVEIAISKDKLKDVEKEYGAKSASYISITKYIREQEDALKKLNKESETPTNMKVKGVDLASLASDIKDKVSTGDINVEKELLNLNKEKANVLSQISTNMELYYNDTYKNNKEEIANIKEMVGATNERLASADGLLRLQDEVNARYASNEGLIANLKDKTLNLDDSTKSFITTVIDGNKKFIDTYNQLATLLGLQKVAIKTAEEAQKDATDASLKQLDVEYKIKQAKSAKGVYESGGTELQVKQKDLDLLKEKIKVQDKLDTSKEGTNKRAEELALAELDLTKAIVSEKSKGASADAKASKELYRQLEAAKAIASLNLEIKQYKEGTYGTSVGQAQVAKLELEFSKMNLETAIKAKAEATEIAKLKREISKAELESIKANDEVLRKQLMQKQALEELNFQVNQDDNGKSAAVDNLEQALFKAKQLDEQLNSGKLNVEQAEDKKLEILRQQQDIKEKMLALDIERIDLVATKEQEALDAQLTQLERIDNIKNIMANSDNANVTKALKMSDTFSNIASKNFNLQKQRSEIESKYKKDLLNKDLDQGRVKEQYTKDQMNLDEEAKAQQIAGYANIAGAMSQMFEEGSKEAAAFQMVESGLAVVAGIKAILTQGSGDPYSAFARMAVMAASVASLLSSADIAFGGIRGGGNTSTGKELTANSGTGTVLGDANAQSESMQKSLEILEEYKKPEFQVLQSMNKYLAGILDSLSGVSSLIVQSGGKAFGQGFKSTDSGRKNNISTKGLEKLNLFDALTGTSIMGDIMNTVVGGLFGKTSSWSELKGSGISFGNQLLKNAINEIFGSEYQTIKTTTKTSSWLKGTQETSETKTKYYNMAGFTETERQFSLILGNMYNSVYEAGILLGENSDTLISNLDNFVVKLGNISFKGKSAAQIQKDLESVFGAVGDKIAKKAIPELKEFQNIGEGTFETLTRVATGMEVAGYYAERLGTSFEKIDFRAIENKQGDIGFEALLQSIEKYDESLYGVDNNLMLIVENMDGTAEELYGVYDSLSNLRDMLAYLKLDTDAVSYATIRGAGSAEALTEAMSSYFENFLTDTQKVEFTTQQLRKEFTELNMVMPETKEGFTDLIESIDLSTESGQELYGRLIILSDGFNSLNESIIESQANVVSFLNSFKTDDLIANDLAKSLGIPLATTFDELATTFGKLLSDGLTDEELNFLNINKSQIELLQNKVLEDEKELAQTRLDNTKKELDLLKSSISTIESITSNLKSTIDKLRESSDTTNTYTLNKFTEYMAKTQQLMKGKDYKAIQDSLQETIGYSSALSDSKNFALSRDMQFAQLVAANQFEAMDLTLTGELDYLKLIEENTANTVNTLTDTLKRLETSITSSQSNQSSTVKDAYAAMQGQQTSNSLNASISEFDRLIQAEKDKQSNAKSDIAGLKIGYDEKVADKGFIANAQSLVSSLGTGTTKITAANAGQYYADYQALATKLGLGKDVTRAELAKAASTYLATQSQTSTAIQGKQDLVNASDAKIAELQKQKNDAIYNAQQTAAGNANINLDPLYATAVVTNPSTTTPVVTPPPAGGVTAVNPLLAGMEKALADSQLNKTKDASKDIITTKEAASSAGISATSLTNIRKALGLGVSITEKEMINNVIPYLKANPTISFAVGTPNVPYDMMANIHQGEIIVPRTYAEGLRSGDLTMSKAPQPSMEIAELIIELKEIKEENKKMSQLLTKLTADNSRMLNLERAKV